MRAAFGRAGVTGLGWQGIIDTGPVIRVPLPRRPRRSGAPLPPPPGGRAPWRRKLAGLVTPARVVILGLLLGILVLGHGAFRAITEHPAEVIPPPPPTAGYETEDHFPGAQLFYVSDAEAAPTAGVTGTTQLPDLPVPPEVAAQAGDGSAGGLAGTIQPARPFSMAAASATDQSRALQCLTAAIYYEAASEPDAGQQAVAQVILNRARHPAFPNTVCGVVYQGSERSTGCQFSFACDGSMARVPSRFYWARAQQVAAAALAGRVMPAVGLATHYHTYAVTPSWNRQLVMTAAIGAHFFHRWSGWWGTLAAFRQVYSGNEPYPGPHQRPALPIITPPLGGTAAPSVAAARPTTAAQVIQPGYATSGLPVDTAPSVGPEPTPRAAPTRRSTGTDESQILPQWRDSGRPID